MTGADLLIFIAVALASFVAMEWVATLAHKHIMHGLGWGWHRDHHHPTEGPFERNDRYSIIALMVTVLLFVFSTPDHWLWWMALGITGYGLVYALVHDGLVHRRWPMRWQPKHPYLKRLINAHHLHHAVREKEGAVSYGFLYAPPLDSLRKQLKNQQQS